MALQMGFEEIKSKISSLKPYIVGITSMTPTIESAIKTAAIVKEAHPEALVILGGVHPTFMDKEILQKASDVDAIVRGEGEQTIVEIASVLAHGEKLTEIAGITFKENGKIVRTPDRPYIEDLDGLPTPAFKHFPLERYKVFGRRILPIVSSRGCPFQCSFCVTSRFFGRKVRMRSPKNVVDEIDLLIKEYRAEAITFYDDTFTYDKKRVEGICDEILGRGIDVSWDCQTRADQVSPELLAKMRRAGCEVITLGVESASQNVLKAVGKGTTIKQNEDAVKMIKKAGISVVTSVIVGYPGENVESVRQTLDFLKRLKPDDAYVCVATPYPGTELYRLVKEKGWEMVQDYSKYDTLTPVFENPLISKEEILEMRRKFYDGFYSPIYILRQAFKGGFYNRILARIAVNHFIWRLKSAFKVKLAKG
jgi:radical SAM superfamily enzyme YgiQ (UPF0313 family)